MRAFFAMTLFALALLTLCFLAFLKQTVVGEDCRDLEMERRSAISRGKRS